MKSEYLNCRDNIHWDLKTSEDQRLSFLSEQQNVCFKFAGVVLPDAMHRYRV